MHVGDWSNLGYGVRRKKTDGSTRDRLLAQARTQTRFVDGKPVKVTIYPTAGETFIKYRVKPLAVRRRQAAV